MEKIQINPTYKTILTALLVSLLIYGLYSELYHWNYINLIPIILQGVVLFYLLTHNNYVRIAIKIWTGIIIFGVCLQIIAAGIYAATGTYHKIIVSEVLENIIFLIIAIPIFRGSSNYIQINEVESAE